MASVKGQGGGEGQPSSADSHRHKASAGGGSRGKGGGAGSKAKEQDSNVQDFYALDTVDFGRIKDEVNTVETEEDNLVQEAIRKAQGRKFDMARDVAEAVLMTNPSNAAALHINASECESRQDWAEAARFFLAGLGHNNVDAGMEHGFNTNVDMLRANRQRVVERAETNKWDSVLTFKPKPPKQRNESLEDKPAWYRLGEHYEEIVQEGGFVDDIIGTQAEVDEERMEVRRLIYEHGGFLNVMYGYYKADMNEDWGHDRKPPGYEPHTGWEGALSPDEEHMQLDGLWRILKECKIAYGDVKHKYPIAVFDRAHVQGKRRVSKLTAADSDYNVVSHDPHLRSLPVPYYDFVETLIRVAFIRLSGTISQRFEALIHDFLKAHAMKKQTDRYFLDFRSSAVQNILRDPPTDYKLRRVFEHFVQSYKAAKLRSNIVGSQDLSMSLNHVLVMMEKLDMFDPSYNIKKCAEMFARITCDSDLLPQEHANNSNSEMVFTEFCDFLLRTAKTKNNNKENSGDIYFKFLNQVRQALDPRPPRVKGRMVEGATALDPQPSTRSHRTLTLILEPSTLGPRPKIICF